MRISFFGSITAKRRSRRSADGRILFIPALFRQMTINAVRREKRNNKARVKKQISEERWWLMEAIGSLATHKAPIISGDEHRPFLCMSIPKAASPNPLKTDNIDTNKMAIDFTIKLYRACQINQEEILRPCECAVFLN